MAMAAGGKKGGAKSDINVTPLVDVVLVLLIIFMVITPMLQRGKAVTLPKAKNTAEEGKGKADPVILSVTADKKMWVESDGYDDDAQMEARLKGIFEKEPGKRLLLKGDDTVTFGDVRRVMKVANKAGAKTIALGVEELKQ